MDKNKAKLTFLLLIAVVPVSLATWVFGLREVEGVSSTTNRGELITPVMDILEFDMRDQAGELLFESFEDMVSKIDVADYEPRPWMLVYLGTNNCNDACGDRLHSLRQLHRRLSSEVDRVKRFYINAGSAGQQILDERTQAMFDEAFTDMGVAYSDRRILLNNLKRSHEESVDPIESHYIYVVDPLGNVMLYFTPENTTEEIFKDLDKLLDQSSLG